MRTRLSRCVHLYHSGSQATSVEQLAEKPNCSQGKKELLTLQALPLKKRKKLLRGVRKDLKEEILRRQVEEKPLSKSACEEISLPLVLGNCISVSFYKYFTIDKEVLSCFLGLSRTPLKPSLYCIIYFTGYIL